VHIQLDDGVGEPLRRGYGAVCRTRVNVDHAVGLPADRLQTTHQPDALIASDHYHADVGGMLAAHV
jgi:hypothetical protein